MKQCTKCRETKSLDFFSTNSRTKDGRHSWCRGCVNQQRADRRDQYRETQRNWRDENKGKVAASDSARRVTPEYKAMKALSDAQYRLNNAESIAARKRKYYAERPELKLAEYQRNKQSYVARAYQRLRNIKCLTPHDADRTKIQAFYDAARKMTELTGMPHEVDHIIPVSAGGLHHHNNLQVLTRTQNRQKGARLDAIFTSTMKGSK